MIGIILAAGVGSRLRPMTTNKPKCLVTTAGKPMLQYQLDAYQYAGIDEIVIVTGYEGDRIREYCKRIKGIKLHIINNLDYEMTNNMYSLYLTRDIACGRPFILNNADLSIDRDIISRVIAHKKNNVVAVDTGTFSTESMKITTNDAGRINNIEKNIDEPDAYGCSIDIYKFSASGSTAFFNEIQKIIILEGNCKDWTEVAMQRMFRSGALEFFPCDISGSRWMEVDDYTDLARSDLIFSGYKDRMRDIDTICFDLDGTIYIGDKAVDGAAESIESLRRSNKTIYFLSNNSSRSKAEYVDKLISIGIDADETNIILSTDGLLHYFKEQKTNQVFVLGTRELKDSIRREGIDVDSDNPEFVVVGYDTELTYTKLIAACEHINAGVDIIATHRDICCPSESGPIPDAGAILKMLEATTGKTPIKIFGKPSADMIPSFKNGKLDPTKTLIVGDRLYTDIAFAQKIGANSVLVLSGDTQREAIENTNVTPDFVLTSVADMYNESHELGQEER